MYVTEFFSDISILLAAVVTGYILGALPVADQMSRRHGVDIFSVGTGLAGASNVRRHVGNAPGALVLVGDMAKGVLAIITARLMGVEGAWILLPATASIVGHWKSVFSRFRGGDGLAILGGIILALFTTYGIIVIALAMIVALGGQKIPYPSLLSIVVGYLALVMFSMNYGGDLRLTFGAGGLAALVLARASWGHLRPRASGLEEDDDTEGAAEHTRFKP
jgi:glycerol-3-phosphate acyltransferase PlsY